MLLQHLHKCCWILRICPLCTESRHSFAMFQDLVGAWGSAWEFPQGSICLEFDLCNAVSPIRKFEPDRSNVFQLKMFYAVMSSDTCQVAGETPFEADQFCPYRTSEGRCWICVEHWWNGDWVGTLPHGHFINHKFCEGSWYVLVLILRDSSNHLSFGMVCKLLPASKFHTMMVCVVSAAVKILT